MLATMYIKPGEITSSWEALVHISYNVEKTRWEITGSSLL